MGDSLTSASDLSADAPSFVPANLQKPPAMNANATAFVPKPKPPPQGMSASSPAFVPKPKPPPQPQPQPQGYAPYQPFALPVHPPLPAEKVPQGYILFRKWHWTFDTWAASAGIQWDGYDLGFQPHYNLTPANGFGHVVHVYYLGGQLLIIDTSGVVQGAVA